MRTFLISLLALTLAIPAHAQDDPMQDEPENTRSEKPYTGIFGFGGGPQGIWHFANMDALNEAMVQRAMPELSEDGMFMFGGHGYVYVMIIPNFRIGGSGASGSLEATRVVNDQYQNTKLSTTFGGFTMEYTYPFGRFHIGVGLQIGGGSNTLTLTRESSGVKTWDDIPVNAGGRAVLENGFFVYQPTLTAEYELSPFTILSLSGGYFGTSGDEWKLNDEFEIADMPDFEFNNVFVRLQLTFGLFIGE